jgi:hypothetical protein
VPGPRSSLREQKTSFAASDLDEIAVGIAEVDGANGADRPGARAGTLDHRVAERCQLFADLDERLLGDKAQIGATWHGMVGLRLKLVASDVQVDLVAAEMQRLAALSKVTRRMRSPST